MSPCSHVFQDPARTCPHPATSSGRCLWHSPLVKKGDAYVRTLLELSKSQSLAEGHLAHARLPGMDLSSRDLSRCDLRDIDLRGANLAGCDIAGANLRRADLRGADLRGANLRGADLSDCRLDGANLCQADASGCLLDGTDLRGADLRDLRLDGARVGRFRWNRNTRFAGVTGFAALPEGATPTDETQSFPSPFASQSGHHQGPSGLSLTDPDPEAERTQMFEPVPATEAALPVANELDSSQRGGPGLPDGPAAPRRRSRWPLVLGLTCVLALGGGLGVVGKSFVASGQKNDPVVIDQTVALRAQIDANLAELANARTALASVTEERGRLQDQWNSFTQRHSAAQAEQEAIRARLRAADAETLRLQAADDRALSAALSIDDLQQRLQELAKGSSRQESIARILAAGVERLQADNARLSLLHDNTNALKAQVERLSAERDALAGTLASTRNERDRSATALAKARADLAVSEQAISQYLTKLSASSLQEALGDELDRLPMHALRPGQAIALTGRYAMTVRLTHGGQTHGNLASPSGRDPVLSTSKPSGNTTNLSLVLQRPSSEANPDVTIILYDREQQPLRRLAFGFPHTDAGPPVMTADATFSLDREPAFARVIVTPVRGPVQAKAEPSKAQPVKTELDKPAHLKTGGSAH